MTGTKGLFIIRRTLFFCLGVAILLFGTTPTVIISEVDVLMQTFDLKSKSEAYSLIITYLQPMFVIMLN